MEDYKAQYYNEALLHYGVKGMRLGVRRRQRKVRNLDKRIASLQEKSMAAKRGRGAVNAFNAPKTTGYVIKYNKIKRDGVKQGDSRKVTRLKTKQARLQDNLDALNANRKRTGHETGKQTQAFNQASFALQRTKRRLERAQEKKKKKKQ